MRFCICAAVALAVACGSSSGSKTPDAASTADAFATKCGKPGDTGNDVGVGKYCADLNDCTSSAPLCSVLGDPMTHFCTRTCQGSGSNVQCGSDATCTCNSNNQCGCTPNACL